MVLFNARLFRWYPHSDVLSMSQVTRYWVISVPNVVVEIDNTMEVTSVTSFTKSKFTEKIMSCQRFW